MGTSSSNIFVDWNPVHIDNMGGTPVGYVIFYESVSGHTGNQSVLYNESSIKLSKLKSHSQYLLTVCGESIYGVGVCTKVVAFTLGVRK